MVYEPVWLKEKGSFSRKLSSPVSCQVVKTSLVRDTMDDGPMESGYGKLVLLGRSVTLWAAKGETWT